MLIPASIVVLGLFGIALFTALSQDDDDLPSPTTSATFEVGRAPIAVLVDGHDVFVSNAGDQTVVRLDAATGDVLEKSDPLIDRPGGLALGPDGRLWVGAVEGTVVTRLDPETLRVAGEPIDLGPAPASLAATDEGVWVAVLNAGLVARIDSGGQITERIRDILFPSAVSAGASGVYVTDVTRDALYALDDDGGGAREIAVGLSPTSVAVADDAVWVGLFGDEAVSRVSGEQVETLDVGAPPAAIAIGREFVWATLPNDDAVIRIDPESLELVGGPVPVGDNPQGIHAAEDGSIWVTNQDDGTVTRIRP